MAKCSESPCTTTREIGRALPTTPTNWPTTMPRPECDSSSHDGRSPSGVRMVMSQRPRIGSSAGAPPNESAVVRVDDIDETRNARRATDGRHIALFSMMDENTNPEGHADRSKTSRHGEADSNKAEKRHGLIISRKGP